MRSSILPVLVCAVLAAGCATQAATSGRLVIRDQHAAADPSFGPEDRALIEQYYREARQARLHPELARRNGTPPPGLARRDTLPSGLAVEPLPAELEGRLTPLPRGYVRVRVGGDILLIERSTRVVLDILPDIAG